MRSTGLLHSRARRRPLLWQHLFWFFGHPEVYIIFLPAAGMVSMMVPTLARTPLVGHGAIAWALAGVGVISSCCGCTTCSRPAWARWRSLTSAASFAVALPSAVQVFAWIATFWKGRVGGERPPCSCSAFHLRAGRAHRRDGGRAALRLAGARQLLHRRAPALRADRRHGVPLFAGLYYWAPLVRGHRISERVGRWSAGLMFVGFNLAFFPIAGLAGMPRRVYTYRTDWAGRCGTGCPRSAPSCSRPVSC